MIDWVSIVRHSRRRFSDYMYGVPIKVRKRRTKRTCHFGEHVNRSVVTRASKRSTSFCGCCWNHKTRYAGGGVEEQLPPPPSPPQLKEASQLDGVPRPNSVDRILHPDGSQHILTSHDTLNKSHDSWQGHDGDQGHTGGGDC